MHSFRAALTEDLDDLRRRSLYRSTRRLESAPGPTAVVEGRRLLVFGSNNYLGLTEHPEIREAAARAAREWGAGSSGSRLTTGTLALHEELEAELASFKSAEATLLFAAGYQANLATIPALAGRGDLILSDALNHASLIDGCRLSRAEVRVYRHGDAAHARELLADRERYRRSLVVTDGVFSMDGDLAPLPALADLCDATGSWLMVDDAHGTGVLGPTGAGTAEHYGVEERVHVRMGTLSKALGAEGGFVAGCRELIETLRNRARGFIFSTAPAPPSTAAALAALRILRREPERVARLAENSGYLRRGLQRIGCAVPDGITPILPVLAGEADAALSLAQALEERGIWVPAIRPPTVPEGTARLRVSVMATHTREQLEEVVGAFGAAGVRR
jgi:8-amino-7-oxononanoate synthase